MADGVDVLKYLVQVSIAPQLWILGLIGAATVVMGMVAALVLRADSSSPLGNPVKSDPEL